MILAALIGWSVWAGGCSKHEDDPVLANVAGRQITVGDVEWAWNHWKGPQEKPSKEDVLRILVDKQILVVEAQRRSLERRPMVVQKLQEAERKELANRLYKKEVFDKVSVSEEEMRRYFEESGLASKREVRARHIMVKTWEEAEEIRKALIEGADFAKLAKEKSLDKVSAGEGGDLGYWREGTVVGPTAEAVFALKVGELSRPVKDGTGHYHLIQVTDQRLVPYEAQKEKIRNILLGQKRLKRRKAFFDELKQRFHLHPVAETASLLTRESRFCFDRLPDIAQKDQGRVLLKYDGGEVAVRTYLDWIREERPTRRPRADSTRIVRFAESRALETLIAPEVAWREGLDRTPDLQAYLRREKEDLLVKELRRVAVVDSVLTESRIEAFYQSHKAFYRDSTEIIVECALLEQKTDAEEVFRAVRQGEDMAQVMRRYPLFDGKWPNYSVFSVLAFRERREKVKKIAEVARVHDVGDLVPPFPVAYRLEGKDLKGYIVMWVRKRREGGLRPLSAPEVRAQVVSRLELRYGEEIGQRFERFMDTLRNVYADEIVLYKRNMKYIRTVSEE